MSTGNLPPMTTSVNPKNDEQFKTNLAKWADVSDLNTMPGTKVKVSGNFVVADGYGVAKIRLTNDSNRVHFSCGPRSPREWMRGNSSHNL
jgi:hypothetical protein